MTEIQIRDKVIELDILTRSEYNFSTHLPYPTLDRIYEDTGINLIELEGSTHKAEAKIRLFTTKAYRILVYGKVEKTNRDLEYLIATSLDFRESFIQYVTNLIGDVFISGNNSILMSSESESSESLRQRARLYHSGSLDAARYDVKRYEYRLGY